MLHLRKIITSWIRSLFSDLRSAIVALSVSSLVLGGGGFLIFFENARKALIEAIYKPLPVWSAFALAFLVIAYTYLKTRSQSRLRKPKPKTEFFTYGDLKWKVIIHRDDWHEVDKTPFCSEHDVQFIYGTNRNYCPYLLKEKCANNLRDSDHHRVYSSASSIIESKLRNHETLC